MTTVIIGKTGLTFNSAGVPTDSNAVHVNVSNEISGLTEKVSPVAGDFLIIEDSANSFAKRKVDVDNLPGGGGGGGGTNVKVDGGATLTTADFTDGGDIDFTDTGGTITAAINADAVTFAKMQNISTARILGRNSASSGDTEELAAATVRTMLNVEDGATADQSAGEIEAIVNHDNLVGFVAAEHIDWSADQGATNIDPGNITGLADANIASGANIDAAKIGTGVVSTTEFNFLDGVTAGIQGQIDGLAGAGVSDGDKGDITVSGSGTVWTIDNTVVTFAKIQNIATATFVGRTTAGAGSAEALTATQARAILNVEDGATADQTAGEIEAIVNHDNLVGFVAAEHIDWTADQGATNIDAANIVNIADANIAGAAAIDASKIADGTVSNAEFQRLDGVTADIQGQIDGKAPSAGSSSIVTVGTVTVGNVDAVVSPATQTLAGKIEIASPTEINAGTDDTRAISPDGLAGSNYGIQVVQLLVFDDSEDVASGDGAGDIFFRVPSTMNGMNLVGVAAQVQTAGTTGTTDVQIHNVTGAADMLSTVLTIDTGTVDSSAAANPAVIDAANDDVSTGDQLRIDVDAVSTTAPKGLLVELQFRLP